MNYDQKEAKRRAEIMLAYAEGAGIEVRKVGNSTWSCATNPFWDWFNKDYRIKKEPRVFYINLYPNSSLGAAMDSRERADNAADCTRLECIKVVEVVEDAT